MKKWSTAEDTIKCNFFLSNIKDLKIVYKQNGEVVLTRTLDDVQIDLAENLISFTWKQTDWVNIKSGKLTFDVSVSYNDSNRIDTERIETYVEIPNNDGVM